MSAGNLFSLNSGSAHNYTVGETIDSNVAMDEIKDLGQLKILWQRIFFGKETVQEHYGHDTKTISEVSEKVLKGRAIENAIQ